jgi:Uma2 family endonuclease
MPSCAGQTGDSQCGVAPIPVADVGTTGERKTTIELLSASDNLIATKVKMQRRIENGAKLAWLVDPYGRKVYVYLPGVAPLTVSDSTVRGTGPVEGFVLDLTRVWRGFRV